MEIQSSVSIKSYHFKAMAFLIISVCRIFLSQVVKRMRGLALNDSVNFGAHDGTHE